jgi:hypothetical protein
MGVVGAGPCRPLNGQHAINFYSVGARAFSQWERLVPAPADLSLVNMLFILPQNLFFRSRSVPPMGAAVAGPCRPLSGQHATGQRVCSHARNGDVFPSQFGLVSKTM